MRVTCMFVPKLKAILFIALGSFFCNAQQSSDFELNNDREFDQLDAQLEANFQQTDQLLEARYKLIQDAIQAAFKKQTVKIEKMWKDKVVVPDGATWVVYGSNYEQRLVYDFEAGFYELEVLNANDGKKNLATLIDRIQSSPRAAIESMDVFSQAISTETASFKRDGDLVDGFDDHYQMIAELTKVPRDLNIENLDEKIDNNIDNNEVKSNGSYTVNLKDGSVYEVNDEEGITRLRIPFVNNYQQKLIEQRLPKIVEMSERFDVEVSLIMAIIEAESSFNPMATSRIPAFGLMQLVPQTAGIDAYRHIYGEQKLLAPEYLYNVENNLKLGTAYLNLLRTRYLKGIDDKDNQLYSVIASYNTGVGNLAGSLIGAKDIRQAIPSINGMNGQEYFQYLQTHLPAQETKDYLHKVISNKKKYQHLDNRI